MLCSRVIQDIGAYSITAMIFGNDQKARSVELTDRAGVRAQKAPGPQKKNRALLVAHYSA
jgi:hypothetical protein